MAEELKKKLTELGRMTAEAVRPSLAEEIKRRIPTHLVRHRGRRDTVNIVIDLRISKLAAAAAIIIATVLLTSFFGAADSRGGGLYQDGKLLVKFLVAGEGIGSSGVLAGISALYEDLVEQGLEVEYYGEGAGAADSNSIVMQWRISEDKYKVVLVKSGDWCMETVTAEELIRFQAQMLRSRGR